MDGGKLEAQEPNVSKEKKRSGYICDCATGVYWLDFDSALPIYLVGGHQR